MTNVVSMGRTREYLVTRAARHRRAGRYDEAMVLLTKAAAQFGFSEEIELEKARVYDEIGCEEEAGRAYLRVMRCEGEHRCEALFELALSCAQRSDTVRAMSYYEQFASLGGGNISKEMAALLGRQLLEDMERHVTRSRKARVKMLERRAAQCIQQGKTAAAKRAALHALSLAPSASSGTLLACCCLLRNEKEEALRAALAAHKLAPSRVQTICVLSDAYMALGDQANNRKMVYIAAMRAKEPDDLLAAAIESAKYGEDMLTLRMTSALLRREPYHIRAMLLRACALANLERFQEASRLFGRVCGLLPEDTVSEFLFKMTRNEEAPKERLGLGLDVTREEGIDRAKSLLELLYADPDGIAQNHEELYAAVRLCVWALHSPMAGAHSKTVALVALSAMDAEPARNALLDALTDPLLNDSMKLAALQMLTAKEGFKPYYADIGGRLVRLAAGGVSDQPIKSAQANSSVVQQAADVLSAEFPDAPQKLLSLYLSYLKCYPQAKKREEAVMAAALEYVYHKNEGHTVNLAVIARRCGVSRRLCALYVRRFQSLDM